MNDKKILNRQNKDDKKAKKFLTACHKIKFDKL